MPAAPLLIPGVSATVPEGVARVQAGVARVVGALADADVAVVLAAGEESAPVVHRAAQASLAGYGLPAVARPVAAAPESDLVAEALGAAVVDAEELPPPHAVLAVHLGGRWPLVAVGVPRDAWHAALVDLGVRLARVLADRRAVVVATGDLSAGLRGDSPRPDVAAAIFWDEQAVHAVDTGRMEGLGRLGPDEARRVHALGWAPLAVLAGVCGEAKLGLVVRHYSAPRGVGYLVAGG